MLRNHNIQTKGGSKLAHELLLGMKLIDQFKIIRMFPITTTRSFTSKSYQHNADPNHDLLKIASSLMKKLIDFFS